MNLLPPGASAGASSAPLLDSPAGRYHLVFQGDGNLVLYDAGNGGVAYWASNTGGGGATLFTLQPDGNVVLAGPHGTVWAMASGHQVAGSWLVLQDDGNLVLYAPSGEPVWDASSTMNHEGWVASIGDAILSVPESAVTAFVSTLHEVPGVDWAGETLKDFANTAVGASMLRAFATTISGGLASVVGPQLASVAFAVPGLAKGDSFTAAWTSEMAWRIKTLIDTITAGQAGDLSDEIDALAGKLSGEIDIAVEKLIAYLPPIDYGQLGAFTGIKVPDWTSVSDLTDSELTSLANKFGVREDSLQAAIDAYSGKLSFATSATPPVVTPFGTFPGKPAKPGKTFDAKTGKQTTTRPPSPVSRGVLAGSVRGVLGLAQRGLVTKAATVRPRGAVPIPGLSGLLALLGSLLSKLTGGKL